MGSGEWGVGEDEGDKGEFTPSLPCLFCIPNAQCPMPNAQCPMPNLSFYRNIRCF
ncbi:histidine kinase [Nostoc sp.]|uniref:histidine kinase n=1 Tax=Nostoc sp. TaxID=1180 RepID=UPI002FFB7E25